MGLLGVVNVYMSRNNIPIAIVKMANQTYLEETRQSQSTFANFTNECIENRNIYNATNEQEIWRMPQFVNSFHF